MMGTYLAMIYFFWKYGENGQERNDCGLADLSVVKLFLLLFEGSLS